MTHPEDAIEAEARRKANAFRMRKARRRYRHEPVNGLGAAPFRAWARKTYNTIACDGKLAQVVARKDRA